MTTLTDFEHKLDTLIKTYPDGVPRDEMNTPKPQNPLVVDYYKKAPSAGLEPATFRLTAERSAY